MPGLHALRSITSSSSTASNHAKAQAAPPADSRALPAFRTVANPLVVIPSTSHAHPIRLKPIGTDPSTGAAHPRLPDTFTTLNYSSSGSPHDDPSTVCLAAMVHEFLEEEMRTASCGRARCNCMEGVCAGSDNEEKCMTPDEPKESQLPDDQLCEILEGITSCTSKPELLLLVDVAHAVEVETEELTATAIGAGDHGLDDGAVTERLRRPVMKRLRQEGYNAAICKSRWKHADGLPAGDYEYIDIVMDIGKAGSKKQERFIVDVDFQAQFEIARASKLYVQLLGVLPRLFVGRAERLKQILKIMANAAKCSMKQQGLLLPPWRKHKYMQAKWFSPYRRTTNTDSHASATLQGPQDALGLGLRAKIFSLDFTKEMDLLYYKVQAKGLNNYSQHHHAHKRDPSNARNGNVGIVRTGFANNASEYLPQTLDVCTTVRCTDWQLPALDEKCKAGISRDRVSGISAALKQGFLSNQGSSQLAMVS